MPKLRRQPGSHSVLFLCFTMPTAAPTVERAIGKWAFNSPQGPYHTRMKCLYFEMKQVKNFWKAQGRLSDINSGEGLWFEVTGNSRQDVSVKAKNYMKDKAGMYKQLNIKASAFHSGGKVVNLNPGNGHNSVVWSAMATSHPDYGKFQDVTVQPRQDIGQLCQCVNQHRVDAVGLVKEKKITVPNKKGEVWLQGLDRKEVLVEMWGDSFVNLLSQMEANTTVLQVDNARVSVNEKGHVSLSAEFFKDSEKGASWAHLDPPHETTRKLKDMPVAAGQRISSAWEPTNRATLRMVCSDGPKLKSCMGTINACCLAWPGTDGVTPQDALPEQVEVAVQGVWITEIASKEPLYSACLHCNTKIDPTTGLCKKAGPGHDTAPQEEKVALSSVRIADASGSFADVLARTTAICAFAGVENVNELETFIQRRSAEGLPMQGRFDIVLGANSVRKGLGKFVSQGDPECRFEVLRVEKTLLSEWDTKDRPALEKVIESKSSPNTGHVFPVRCPVSDLIDTAGGVKVKDTSVFPSHVMVLGFVKQEPREQPIGEGEDAFVELTHEVVYPQECPQEEQKAFSVEMICDPKGPIIEAARMSDEEPHLIVGRPQIDGEGNVTIMAENIFDLRSIPEAEDHFQKEREGWWELLRNKVEQNDKKRSAQELIQNTPSKKRCTSPLAYGGA